MKPKLQIFPLGLALLLRLSPQISICFAQGTVFTYQGRLNENGSPASGDYDMQFKLYDAAEGGNQVSFTLQVSPLTVSTGLFTASLTFGGSAFGGGSRWLEISVRRSGTSNSFSVLSPRQPLTPTPYAMFAGNAGNSERLGGGTAATFVAKNGDTMTGALNLPSNGLSVGTNQLVVAGGNLGIGTSNPYGNLDVRGIFGLYGGTLSGSAYERLDLRATETDGLVLSAPQRSGIGKLPYHFNWAGGGPDAMTILGNGNVGIGTTTPDALLTVGSSATRGTLNIYGSATQIPALSLVDSRPGGHFFTLCNGTDGPGSLSLVDQNAGATRLMIDRAGAVGIGTNSPQADLHVNGTFRARYGWFETGAVIRHGEVQIQDGPLTIIAPYGFTPVYVRRDGDGQIVDFQGLGNITLSGTTVSYNAFTGCHYAWTTEKIERGALVRFTGENRTSSPTSASEVVYGIVRNTIANDGRCLGAYLSLQEPAKPYSRTNSHLVMAVGNGDMWVADSGIGDIQPGDYLISSDVSGCAMKDDPARFPVGYICARAAEPVVWSEVKADEKGVRRQKISVLFESFVRDSRGAQLASIVKAQQAQLDSLHTELKSLRLLKARLERLEAVIANGGAR